jgi:HPt (histidine-containing phosphotransfer) domain-containing protein
MGYKLYVDQVLTFFDMSKSFSGCKLLNPWLQEMLYEGLAPTDVEILIQVFLDTAPEILKEVQGHLARGDMKGSARAAHRLVGSAANVGVSGLEAVARRLERICDANERLHATEIFDSVTEQYMAAKKELELASTTLAGV